MIAVTIQLCTYNRAALLERVLDACFEQHVDPAIYEIVLVDDGSRDETPAVIERARARARCRFEAITKANGGLASARNVGIAQARGKRIIFIDDDVLPAPNFVAEHLRSDVRHGDVIIRGAVINTESFERLPPPIWTIAHYSGNYFWTSNVSVRRERLARVGAFDEGFREYGWEDIELGMRLRKIGTRAVFNPRALAFHYKPRARAREPEALVRQSEAQARTAVRLAALHPHWRVRLAIGDLGPLRAAARLSSRVRLGTRVSALSAERGDALRMVGARLRANEAYYTELERVRGVR